MREVGVRRFGESSFSVAQRARWSMRQEDSDDEDSDRRQPELARL